MYFPCNSWILHDDPNPSLVHTLLEKKSFVGPSLLASAVFDLLNLQTCWIISAVFHSIRWYVFLMSHWFAILWIFKLYLKLLNAKKSKLNTNTHLVKLSHYCYTSIDTPAKFPRCSFSTSHITSKKKTLCINIMHTNILVVIKENKKHTVNSSKINYIKGPVWDRILDEL